MFSLNPLSYLLAAVAASALPQNLPVQPFEVALAPLLDIAACDGMVDRIRGFEPFSADVQRVRGAGHWARGRPAFR